MSDHLSDYKSLETSENCENDNSNLEFNSPPAKQIGLDFDESKFKPITINKLPSFSPDSNNKLPFLGMMESSPPNIHNPMPPFLPRGHMSSSLMSSPNPLMGMSPLSRGPNPNPLFNPLFAPPLPSSSNPLPMMNPHNFPLPPFFNPLFPFSFGRDLKKIKKWGRAKRKKGKVIIDKETGRKLITAITCVACFKAKKKCVYATAEAKKCNYCINRDICCVKRLDRRCQKIWHESGRQARLKSEPKKEPTEENETKPEPAERKKEDLELNSLPILTSPKAKRRKINHEYKDITDTVKVEPLSESFFYENENIQGSDLLCNTSPKQDV